MRLLIGLTFSFGPPASIFNSHTSMASLGQMYSINPTLRSFGLTLIKSKFADVDFIAAHNANFDRAVLNACCQNAHLDPLPIPFLCTVQLARDVWNIRPTKLPNVCEFLDIPLEHHQALSDAEACAKIVIAARQKKERSKKC